MAIYHFKHGDLPHFSHLHICWILFQIIDKWSIFCPDACLNIIIEFSTVEQSRRFLYFWTHVDPLSTENNVLNNFLLFSSEIFFRFLRLHHCRYLLLSSSLLHHQFHYIIAKILPSLLMSPDLFKISTFITCQTDEPCFTVNTHLFHWPINGKLNLWRMQKTCLIFSASFIEPLCTENNSLYAE